MIPLLLKSLKKIILLLGVLSFFLSGLLFILLPWPLEQRTQFLLILENYPWGSSSFGFLFILIGAISACYLLSSRNRTSYRLPVPYASININLIQQLVDRYWHTVFPDQKIPSQLSIKKNKIYLTVDFPYISPLEQPSFFNKIERELSELVEKTLGYQGDLYLEAAFSKEPNARDLSSL